MKNEEISPLDRLAAQADQGAAESDQEQADEQGAPEGPSLTNEQCLGVAWELIRDTLCGFAGVNTPRITLANERIAPMVKAQAAVLDKYGIDLQATAGGYMVEITAAIATLPVLWAFKEGLANELAASKKTTVTPVADADTKPAPAAAPEFPMAQVVG